jgi:hypothetical protein
MSLKKFLEFASRLLYSYGTTSDDANKVLRLNPVTSKDPADESKHRPRVGNVSQHLADVMKFNATDDLYDILVDSSLLIAGLELETVTKVQEADITDSRTTHDTAIPYAKFTAAGSKFLVFVDEEQWSEDTTATATIVDNGGNCRISFGAGLPNPSQLKAIIWHRR